MTEAWFDIIKNPAYANRQRKTPRNVKARQRKKGRAARVTRRQPEIDAYNEKNTRRDFDVPDTGKKNLLGRMGDRFRQFRDRKTVDSMRQQYQDAQQQAQQNKTDMGNWQSQIRRDDEEDYQAQLAASQKEMAAGTQASKDKAALEAQEKEVERGTRAMDRGALAAQAAQQGKKDLQVRDAEIKEENRKKTLASNVAQQAAKQGKKDLQVRQDTKDTEAYNKEMADVRTQLMEQQKIQQEEAKRSIPLPDAKTEVTGNLPLPKQPVKLEAPSALNQFKPKTAKKKPLNFQQQVEARTGSKTGIVVPEKPKFHPSQLPKPTGPTMEQRRQAGNNRAMEAARANNPNVFDQMVANQTAYNEKKKQEEEAKKNPNEPPKRQVPANAPPPKPQQQNQPQQQNLPQPNQFKSPDSSLQPQSAKQSQWKNIMQRQQAPPPNKIPVAK